MSSAFRLSVAVAGHQPETLLPTARSHTHTHTRSLPVAEMGTWPPACVAHVAHDELVCRGRCWGALVFGELCGPLLGQVLTPLGCALCCGLTLPPLPSHSYHS